MEQTKKFKFKSLYSRANKEDGTLARLLFLGTQDLPREEPTNDDMLKWIRYYLYKEVFNIESKHTARAKAYDLHKLIKFFEHTYGDRSIRRWDKAFTAAFISALEDEYGISSIYRIYATVTNFVNFLILREVIKPIDNPIAGIRLQSVELPAAKGVQLLLKTKLLTSDSKEMYNLLMAAAQTFIDNKDPQNRKDRTCPRRDAAILALLYHTGLRGEEVCSITVSQMEMIAGGGMWLRNVKCKGNKVRKVYVKEEAVALMLDYMEKERGPQREPPFIFRSWRRQKLSPSDIWRILKRIARKAQESLPPHMTIGIHPHSLRHERGFNLRMAGLGDALIAEQLGHSGTGQVARYSRRSEKDEANMLKDI